MKAGWSLLDLKAFNDVIEGLKTQCHYKSDYDSVFICQIVRFRPAVAVRNLNCPNSTFATGLSVF